MPPAGHALHPASAHTCGLNNETCPHAEILSADERRRLAHAFAARKCRDGGESRLLPNLLRNLERAYKPVLREAEEAAKGKKQGWFGIEGRADPTEMEHWLQVHAPSIPRRVPAGRSVRRARTAGAAARWHRAADNLRGRPQRRPLRRRVALRVPARQVRVVRSRRQVDHERVGDEDTHMRKPAQSRARRVARRAVSTARRRARQVAFVDQTFGGRFEIIRGNTLVTMPAAVRARQLRCDVWSIDGGHKYNVALSDLRHAHKLARPSNILIMDDLRCAWWWCAPVSRAWDEARSVGIASQTGCMVSSCCTGWCTGAFSFPRRHVAAKDSADRRRLSFVERVAASHSFTEWPPVMTS